MKEMLWHIFATDGELSAKRVSGMEFLINAIVLSHVNPNATTLINAFLLTGSGLLGVAIASEIVTKVTDRNIAKKEEKEKGNEE